MGVRAVRSLTGGLRGRLEFFTKSHVFDIGKAARVLGFNPRVAVAEGVGRTVLWEERVALVGAGENPTRRRTTEIRAAVGRAPPPLRLERRCARSWAPSRDSFRYPARATCSKRSRAFARRCPSARLLVVGDGAEREALETQAMRLGISPFVIFAGMHEDIAAHLRLCDVAVVASTDDGLSLAAMEALSAGVPLVATRVGGVSVDRARRRERAARASGRCGRPGLRRHSRAAKSRASRRARGAHRSGRKERLRSTSWADGSPRAALG